MFSFHHAPYFRKWLSGLTILALLMSSIPVAFAYPDGYVDDYTIKTEWSGGEDTTVRVYHNDSGDTLQVTYPNGDFDCTGSGYSAYLNGSRLTSTSWTASGSNCVGTYTIGLSAYHGESSVGLTLVSGSTTIVNQGGLYTTWTTSGSTAAEVTVRSGNYTDPNADTDGDGVLDTADNCQYTSNASQTNTDGDSQGDDCDTDDDNDGVNDYLDNCAYVHNETQANFDGDSYGDDCDDDMDNDGVDNSVDEDNFDPTVGVAGIGDGDNDDFDASDASQVGTTDQCAWLDWNNWCMPVGIYAPVDRESGEMCVMWELGGDLVCEDADDGCVWVNYYGECVDYDVWAPAAHDVNEECIVRTGDHVSEIECTDNFDNNDDDDPTDWCDYNDCDDDDHDECETSFYSPGSDNPCDDDYGDRDWEQSLEESREQLMYLYEDLREFERVRKGFERTVEEHERMLEDLEREIEWFTEDGWDTSGLEGMISEVEARISELEALASGVSAAKSSFEDDVEYIESVFDGAGSEEASVIWMITNLGENGRMARSLLDLESSYYETTMSYLEWDKEKTVLLIELDESGAELTGEMTSALDEGEAYKQEYLDAYASALAAGQIAQNHLNSIGTYTAEELMADENYYNSLDDQWQDYWDYSEDFQWAMEDMWRASDGQWEMWDVFEQIWSELEFLHDMGWIVEELDFIRGDIQMMEQAFKIIDGRVSDPNIASAVETVLEVVPKAYAMLDNIEVASDSIDDPEDMEKYWNDLDSLEEYLFPRMEKVMYYLEDHWDELNLSGDEEDIVRAMMEFDEGDDHGGDFNECRRCDRLNDVYNSDTNKLIERYLNDNMVNLLIDAVTASVMESIAQYIDGDLAAAIIEAVMKNLAQLSSAKFGEGFANELLNNGNRVYEKMDGVDFGTSSDSVIVKAKVLFDKFKDLAMPDDEVAGQVADYWNNMSQVVSSEYTDEEMEELLVEGELLYDVAVEATYKNHIDLADMTGMLDEDYGDVWYEEDVYWGLGDKWEGKKNADGSLKYEYDPSGTTLRAEALKMVSSAFGHSWSDGGEFWWSSAESVARSLGYVQLVNSFSDAELGEPISRGEFFRLITDYAGMNTNVSCDGSFPDVSSADANCSSAVALKNAGLVTGDGDTGAADLYRTSNRAEAAALIRRSTTWYEEQDFLEDELFTYYIDELRAIRLSSE